MSSNTNIKFRIQLIWVRNDKQFNSGYKDFPVA